MPRGRHHKETVGSPTFDVTFMDLEQLIRNLWQGMPAREREQPEVRALKKWCEVIASDESSPQVLESFLHQLKLANQSELIPLAQGSWTLCMNAADQKEPMAECRRVLGESIVLLEQLTTSSEATVKQAAWGCLGFVNSDLLATEFWHRLLSHQADNQSRLAFVSGAMRTEHSPPIDRHIQDVLNLVIATGSSDEVSEAKLWKSNAKRQ